MPRARRLRVRLGGDGDVRHGAGTDPAALPHRPHRDCGRRWPGSSSSLPRRGTSCSTRLPDGSATGPPHPDGQRRPFLIRAGLPWPPASRCSSSDRPRRSGLASGVGGRGLPGLRDGIQLLPGALRRDARRDHRRLRRAHPAHDVAGRDPRLRDPRQRRRCPRSSATRFGPVWGYRVVGFFVAALIALGALGAWHGTSGRAVVA